MVARQSLPEDFEDHQEWNLGSADGDKRMAKPANEPSPTTVDMTEFRRLDPADLKNSLSGGAATLPACTERGHNPLRTRRLDHGAAQRGSRQEGHRRTVAERLTAKARAPARHDEERDAQPVHLPESGILAGETLAHFIGYLQNAFCKPGVDVNAFRRDVFAFVMNDLGPDTAEVFTRISNSVLEIESPRFVVVGGDGRMAARSTQLEAWGQTLLGSRLELESGLPDQERLPRRARGGPDVRALRRPERGGPVRD